MPTEQQIRQALRAYISEQFPAARDANLSDHDSLLTSGIVDSMGILELVTFIEGQFSFALTDEEMLADHFETIDSLTLMILARTSVATIQPLEA